MKYGYARVSTVHQRKDGNSLEVQRLRLQQRAAIVFRVPVWSRVHYFA